MRMIGWCIVLILSLVNSGESQEVRKIPAAQAKAIIRQFEGKPNLSLPDPTIYQVDDRLIYHFRLNNGDEYRVNALTGEIQSVFYGSVQSRKITKEIKANILPLSKLEAIAWQQAKHLYKGFKVMKMVLFDKYFDGEAYVFEFRQQLPNGAFTDNGCTVCIRADNGKLLFYSQTFTDIPQEASQIPTVSKEQALEEVRRAIGLVEITRVGKFLLEFWRGKLIWRLAEVEGPFPDGTTYWWSASVDAKTGRVLEISKMPAGYYRQPLRGHTMVGGILLKREYGPIVRGKNLFIPSEVFLTFGIEIERLGNQVVLSAQRRLIVEKNDYYIKGEKIFLSPMLLLKLLPGFVIGIHEDYYRRSINILCANKESNYWLVRHGKNPIRHYDEKKFQKVHEMMHRMGLILE